ncbi:RxLR effector protein [Phytophthora megakarya]|uniref:RxLR effector protein n=1 Tax=Phytophthora megakarya TaxID=4795 RepID=A0A225WK05_9STRA|nr:RxLR effector protein [Phytophthora megakarya]
MTILQQLGTTKHHTRPKLYGWALAILCGLPPLEIGQAMQFPTAIWMRHPPNLQGDYRWTVRTTVTVVGELGDETETPTEGESREYIVLELEANGIHCKVANATASTPKVKEDLAELVKQGSTVVFYAHPRCHKFPWTVLGHISNKYVLQTIKKLPFNPLVPKIWALEPISESRNLRLTFYHNAIHIGEGI